MPSAITVYSLRLITHAGNCTFVLVSLFFVVVVVVVPLIRRLLLFL